MNVFRNRALADRATAGSLALLQPECIKSENFLDLAHGQPSLRQPVSSTSQWRQTGPLVCPARFVKMDLGFHSGDADQHSGIAHLLIGISPES
jgi:hypothetical protein